MTGRIGFDGAEGHRLEVVNDPRNGELPAYAGKAAGLFVDGIEFILVARNLNDLNLISDRIQGVDQGLPEMLDPEKVKDVIVLER